MEDAQLLTDECAAIWSNLPPKWQIQRLKEWAQMLESRVSELDPDYRGYPWGWAPSQPNSPAKPGAQ